jgi:hypothetical protein
VAVSIACLSDPKPASFVVVTAKNASASVVGSLFTTSVALPRPVTSGSRPGSKSSAPLSRTVNAKVNAAVN